MFVGKSKNGRRVISGEYALQMRDTHGIPLSVMLAILEARGWGFDVMGFIEACHDSPNYTLDKCRRVLQSATESPEIHAMIDTCVRRFCASLGDRRDYDNRGTTPNP